MLHIPKKIKVIFPYTSLFITSYYPVVNMYNIDLIGFLLKFCENNTCIFIQIKRITSVDYYIYFEPDPISTQTIGNQTHGHYTNYMNH